MSRLEPERERALLAALRGLARDLKEPPFDPRREQALLALFDRARQRPAAHGHAPLWSGLVAAGLAFGMAATWFFAGTQSISEIRTRPMAVAASPEQPVVLDDSPEFVAVPGAGAWPPFESGELIRVELPVDGGFIEADVIVGQDGFARAVRLVQ